MAARLPQSTPPLRVIAGQGRRASGAAGDAAASRRTAASEAPGRLALLDDRPDAELVVLARAGQSSAVEMLYRRHAPYALALAVRVQGHPGDVEDILHDAFMRIFDRLETLRDVAAFRGWLSSVVVSLVRTRLRRRAMLGRLGLTSREPIDLDALSTADAGPEERAQLAQVYGVLRTLPIDVRIAWTLRFVEGRKLEEVAELTDCSLATAKRRIAAAQQRILVEDLQGASMGGEQ